MNFKDTPEVPSNLVNYKTKEVYFPTAYSKGYCKRVRKGLVDWDIVHDSSAQELLKHPDWSLRNAIAKQTDSLLSSKEEKPYKVEFVINNNKPELVQLADKAKDLIDQVLLAHHFVEEERDVLKKNVEHLETRVDSMVLADILLRKENSNLRFELEHQRRSAFWWFIAGGISIAILTLGVPFLIKAFGG